MTRVNAGNEIEKLQRSAKVGKVLAFCFFAVFTATLALSALEYSTLQDVWVASSALLMMFTGFLSWGLAIIQMLTYYRRKRILLTLRKEHVTLHSEPGNLK